MVYKFQGGNNDLEVFQSYTDTVQISLIDKDGLGVYIDLNSNQLYDLIGALHSIQTKIKKENFDKKSNLF